MRSAYIAIVNRKFGKRRSRGFRARFGSGFIRVRVRVKGRGWVDSTPVLYLETLTAPGSASQQSNANGLPNPRPARQGKKASSRKLRGDACVVACFVRKFDETDIFAAVLVAAPGSLERSTYLVIIFTAAKIAPFVHVPSMLVPEESGRSFEGVRR